MISPRVRHPSKRCILGAIKIAVNIKRDYPNPKRAKVIIILL